MPHVIGLITSCGLMLVDAALRFHRDAPRPPMAGDPNECAHAGLVGAPAMSCTCLRPSRIPHGLIALVGHAIELLEFLADPEDRRVRGMEQPA